MTMQISSVLRRAVQVAPDTLATIHLDRQQTWRSFLERVKKLAGALQNLGVMPNDRVAILSLNSDRYIEYFFATVWAGGAMMPMNIRWAVAECAYALNDAQAKILFVDDAFASVGKEVIEHVSSLKTLVFCGDGEPPDGVLNYETILSAAEPIADAGRCDDDLAGIFYTGGTTGFPKGVMLSHKNFYVSGLCCAQEIRVSEGARYLHAAPMFHIADLLWFMAGTFVSVTHISIPNFTPESTLEAINNHRPTHTVLVPVMIYMMIKSEQINTTDVSSLKRIAYGASPITEAILAEAFEKFPQAQFLQAFGQTELSPVATILDTQFHSMEGMKTGKLRSCGRATRVCEIRIVDENDEDLPIGEVGHIIVKGPNTMLGYWNKPEVTAETIRDGWVYTGDAGHMDEDGFIYLMDRLKDMIVSGGENVYSTEVENALGAHPAVSTSAVIGVPHEKWGEAVHAIVILNSGMEASAEELKEHCHGLIAGYKCPQSITFRSDPFPLSGANKVLKTELRKPFWEGHTRHIS